MKDFECPYCGKDQEVHHDDGTGYEEGVAHQQECSSSNCSKTFVFYTSISYNYEVHRADCLNTGEHNFELTHTFPKYCSRMKCLICDKERDLTPEEQIKYNCVKKD